MLAKTLETIQSSAPKQAIYTRLVFAALAIGVALKAIWFARLGVWHHRNLVDFDAFYIIAQRVWLGDADQAYQFAKLINMQREASGGADSFMPWTYPPQFNLLLAPLALIPTGLAYFLFTAGTLAFYLIVLRSIAASQLALILILLFPAMQTTMACGQNGFLTAGLIGLVCLFIEKRQIPAGLALGLMIIKPHLAIAFAAYSILRRRWTVVMTAGAVVLTSSLVCSAVFGLQIWTGLYQSVHDSAIFLERGYYPLYRMISFYAALRTVGLPAWAAFLGQGVVAALALGIIAIALYRGFSTRSSLGLTAMVSISISPYTYDYDFLIFGIGLALLLPELKNIARESERAIIYTAPMIIGAYGNLQSFRLGTSHTDVQYLDVLSIGGFAVTALIAMIFMILLRGANRDLRILVRPSRDDQVIDIALDRKALRP
jgi:Glycosyltransferase family 87